LTQVFDSEKLGSPTPRKEQDMKKLVLALILVIGTISVIGVMRTSSTHQQDPPIKGQLKWYANRAKNEGRQKVVIPAPMSEYAGSANSNDLEQTLHTSTAVVAHLIDKRTYQLTENYLVTWNKFRIDEVISEAKTLPCPACGDSTLPQGMLPLQSGEFLVSTNSGKMVVDDIEIEQVENGFPEFHHNQRYLLFLYSYPTGFAATVGGPIGVFSVDGKDNVLP
jgi:hypothetical protein